MSDRTLGRTLGGRLATPLTDEQVAAPRDVDDDLLEQLCARAFDMVTNGQEDASSFRALELEIATVRLRQIERHRALLAPLYREEPRPWDKIRPPQHAEARRMTLVHRSTFEPTMRMFDEAMARADKIIAERERKG